MYKAWIQVNEVLFLLCKANKKVVLISNVKFATGATYTLLLPLVPLLPLCVCVMSFILGVWHYCSCPQSVSESLRYFTARQLFVYALFFFFFFFKEGISQFSERFHNQGWCPHYRGQCKAFLLLAAYFFELTCTSCNGCLLGSKAQQYLPQYLFYLAGYGTPSLFVLKSLQRVFFAIHSTKGRQKKKGNKRDWDLVHLSRSALVSV